MTEEGGVILIVKSPVRELRVGIRSMKRLDGCPEVGVNGVVGWRGGGVGLVVGVGHRASGGGTVTRNISALLSIVHVRSGSRDVDSRRRIVCMGRV